MGERHQQSRSPHPSPWLPSHLSEGNELGPFGVQIVTIERVFGVRGGPQHLHVQDVFSSPFSSLISQPFEQRKCRFPDPSFVVSRNKAYIQAIRVEWHAFGIGARNEASAKGTHVFKQGRAGGGRTRAATSNTKAACLSACLFGYLTASEERTSQTASRKS